MKAVIDGRPVEIGGAPTILEAARSAGIEIPTLCFEPRLEPYAACRICLVEIRGRNNPVTACATPLEEGMEIVTNSEVIRTLRREVLSLILSEHPSACLICAEKTTCDEFKSTIRKTGEPMGCVLCPANGRCGLQTVVESVGLKSVFHPMSLREAGPRRDDPFIDRDDHLCILCGRCVRVCHEIRGADALAFIARGGRSTVGTSMGKTLLESGCRFCGACVDLCPTGALAERAVRYSPRPDETRPVVCGLCGQGCALEFRLHRGRPIDVRPLDGPANAGQACVKGRFIARELLTHPKRLTRPLIRRGGSLVETSWEEALAAAGRGLGEAKGNIGVVLSAQDSCEDLWALGLFARDVLRTPFIEIAEDVSPFLFGRSAESAGGGAGTPEPETGPGGVSAPARDRSPGRKSAGLRTAEVGRARSIFIFEEALPLTAPILGLEVHKALRKGAKLAMIGDEDYCSDRCASLKVKVGPAQAGPLLLALLRTLIENDHGRAPTCIEGYEPFKRALRERPLDPVDAASVWKLEKLIALIEKRHPAAYIFGPRFLAGPWGPRNAAALWNLALLTGGMFVPVGWEANTPGAVEILPALRPSETGGRASGRPEQSACSALFLAGSKPSFVRRGEEFVVVLDAFHGEAAALADVVLPRTIFAEQDGVFVNGEGRLQRSRAAFPPAGEARPGFLIASALARALGAKTPAFSTADEALTSLASGVPAFVDSLLSLRENRPAFLNGAEAAVRGLVEIPDRDAVFDPTAGRRLRDPDDYLGFKTARRR